MHPKCIDIDIIVEKPAIPYLLDSLIDLNYYLEKNMIGNTYMSVYYCQKLG
jgi:hypothetical protein